MRFLIYSVILTSMFFGEMCHAMELKNLAGRFHIQSSEENREMEITYFEKFHFDGVDESFEALKFGNSFISIIKDSHGRLQLSEKMLDKRYWDPSNNLDAKETQDTISSQPNSYTRILLAMKDQNNIVISISYKLGTISIGPHIDFFPRWKKTPHKVITLKRIP